MSIVAFTSPRSGLWPWGLLTVSTVGTAVPLNLNIGPQTATPSTHPTGMVRQLIVAAPTTNTGNTYVLVQPKGVTVSAASTPNFVVIVVPAGTTVTVPSFPISASINADDLVADADTNNNAIYVVGYYA